MKDKKIIYISGPMTGLPNYNFDKFNEVETLLKILKYKVINPATISLNMSKKLKKALNEISREEFLKEDIKQLLKCTHIFMLDGWEKSEGANLEYTVAKAIGLIIIFE